MTSAQDGERQPLLQHQSDDQSDAGSKASKAEPLSRHWPIIRVMIAVLFFQVAYYTYSAKAVDSCRAYICAAYYEEHPDLQSPDAGPCQLGAIESRFARSDSTLNLLAEIANTISVLLLVPLLSLGRKRLVFLITMGGILSILPYLVLPFGYPFGPRGSELAIDPRYAFWIIAAARTIDSACGSTLFSIMIFRSMAIDVAAPARRTAYLGWIGGVNSMGIFVGPIVSGLLTQVLPAVPVKGSILSAIMHLVGRHPRLPPVGSPPPGSEPFPAPSPAKDDPNNVLPYYLGVGFYIACALWVALVIPETAVAAKHPHSSLNTDNRADDASSLHSKKGKKQWKNPFDILRVIGPRRNPATGKLDLRMPLFGVATHLGMAAGAGYNALFYFLGFKMRFSAEKVGYFLSGFGASRMVVLFALPALVAILNRTLRRPVELRHLDQAQMVALAKREDATAAAADEEDEFDAQEEDELLQRSDADLRSSAAVYGATQSNDSAGGSRVSANVDDLYRQEDGRRSAYGLEGVLGSSAPQQHDEDAAAYTSRLLRALSLFRAKRDLFILRFGFLFDVAGWLTFALAAHLLSTPVFVLGIITAAFGSVCSTVLLSTAIAVRWDQQDEVSASADFLQNSEEPPSFETRHERELRRKEVRQQLSDRVIGALGFLDQLSQLWAQPLQGIIYGYTVSNHPATIFLCVTGVHAVSFTAMCLVWI